VILSEKRLSRWPIPHPDAKLNNKIGEIMDLCKDSQGSAVSRDIIEQMEQGNFIRKAFEEGLALKKKYGEKKVFDLSLGNPILEPPPEFHRELQKLVNSPSNGMHRYMLNAGYPEVRAEIAEYMAEETGLPFTQNEIIMSVGAGGGLNLVLKALLNREDEVIVFAPYFPEYLLYIASHQGVARIVPTDDNFVPDFQALAKAITSRTKVIIINSPNNPTGVVYDENTWKNLGEVIRARETHFGTQIHIMNDEPYRKLNYTARKFPYAFDFHPRTISVTSHSKDLSIPGERIGYVAINPQCNAGGELGTAVGFCNRALGVVNAPGLMQRVISKLQRAPVNVEAYKKKRDFIYQNLKAMGYSMVKPDGAFYLFPRSPVDDLKLCDDLRQERVLVVPGIAFGTPGYFRIAYCVEDWVLENCLPGFQSVAKKYGIS
jgi:aspartate aminotransferase